MKLCLLEQRKILSPVAWLSQCLKMTKQLLGKGCLSFLKFSLNWLINDSLWNKVQQIAIDDCHAQISIPMHSRSWEALFAIWLFTELCCCCDQDWIQFGKLCNLPNQWCRCPYIIRGWKIQSQCLQLVIKLSSVTQKQWHQGSWIACLFVLSFCQKMVCNKTFQPVIHRTYRHCFCTTL